MKSIFKDYDCNDFDILNKIFPIEKEDLLNEWESLLDNLIDFNGQYHHLMKELFIFNRLWSNQKLFYNNSIEKMKNSKLKYKNINYYTSNYQRPILYPFLDYKYRFPKFTTFKKDKNFFRKEDLEDDYNFDLDCPKLEEIIYKYNKNIIEKISQNKNNENIKKWNICLIKQEYHIPGLLFVIKNNNKLILYFYSRSYNLKESPKKTCNNSDKNDICHGSIFKCLRKENHKKIRIDFDDIRMILIRIYYYRNSAFEIFTNNKSYYFNFNKESHLIELKEFLFRINEKSNLFFPINVHNNKNSLGFIRLNQKFIKENIFHKMASNFVEYIFNKINIGELNEICIFDIILLINLISNRSFIDLNQYPVFPIIFFYDKKNNELDRDLKNHIGFQDISQESRLRKESLIELYKENSLYVKDEDNILDKEIVHFFNIHYSNIVYTSNYMIRIFPYSFLAIELQGDGFDDPNRLFFSIEDAFYNILSQKSDLRELIPEFYYLPEMFMNINSINFHKRSTGEPVDFVIMPKLSNENINTINNEIQRKDYFTFVYELKIKLEKNKKDIGFWLNIIFGTEQRYKKKEKKEKNYEQYFRTESYIGLKDKDINYEKYAKNEIIIKSAEFGLIPLQTIFDKNIGKIQKRKNTYKRENDNEDQIYKRDRITKNKTLKEKSMLNINNIQINNNDIQNNILEKEKNNYIYNYSDNDKINPFYFRDNFNVKFEVTENYNFEKISIYLNDNLIKEIYDHNEKITYIFYNPRLNMFATSSYDGLACIYVFPNKLFSVIKHSKGLFFDKIFLSANPFPTIITFEKINNILSSYSLNGILIKEIKINNENKEIDIKPNFNVIGGIFIDKIEIIFKGMKKIISYNLPFFEEQKNKNFIIDE